MKGLSTARIWDVFNLILGLFLFFSPWLFAFEAGRQSQNAYVTGIVVAVLSLAALLAYAAWKERLNLFPGAQSASRSPNSPASPSTNISASPKRSP